MMQARLMEIARRQLAQGHAHGAMESLRQVLAADPDQPDAHALLAVCLYHLRRLHAARYEAGVAVSLAPESALAHYAAGIVETAARHFARAAQHLEQALALEPDSPELLRAQARLCELRGRPAEADAALQRALALGPEEPETLVALGERALAAGRLDEASARADAALRAQPENVDALVLMGQVLLRRGHAADAREHALQALRGDATHRGALQLLAGVKARRNPFLGLWWRYNVWMETIGTTRSILVLLVAYALYRIGLNLARQQGLAAWTGVIEVAWLAIVAYTWIGPALFHRSLARELAAVRLSPRF